MNISDKELAKLLVYVDGSEGSDVALRFAAAKFKFFVAQGKKCEILLLNVMENSVVQALLMVADSVREEQKREAEEILNSSAKVIQDLTGELPVFTLAVGDVAEKISGLLMSVPNIAVLIIGFNINKEENKLAGFIGDILEVVTVPVVALPSSMTDKQINDLV